MSTRNLVRVDVAIVGGGITGLWLLALLRARGYRAVLIERSAFGDGQTICSQGMIHGGTKYALDGTLGATSRALAAMPARWRDCLRGRGEVDLRGVEVLCDRYYLWTANDGTLGRLAGFLASGALRGRVKCLEQAAHPAPFDDAKFSGAVYELDELVLDPRSLLARLADTQRGHTLCGNVGRGDLIRDDAGALRAIRVGQRDIAATHYVLSAGAGNAALVDALTPAGPRMQLRALHQVILRRPHLPPLFAHCVDASAGPEPRITVTSHVDAHGERVWYLGGRLATQAGQRSDADQLRHARTEIEACLPWIDLSRARLQSLRIDRAEPSQEHGRRPDGAFVAAVGNALVCWPTKLALVPDLGDRVLAALTAPQRRGEEPDVAFDGPSPPVANAPWN